MLQHKNLPRISLLRGVTQVQREIHDAKLTKLAHPTQLRGYKVNPDLLSRSAVNISIESTPHSSTDIRSTNSKRSVTHRILSGSVGGVSLGLTVIRNSDVGAYAMHAGIEDGEEEQRVGRGEKIRPRVTVKRRFALSFESKDFVQQSDPQGCDRRTVPIYIYRDS